MAKSSSATSARRPGPRCFAGRMRSGPMVACSTRRRSSSAGTLAEKHRNPAVDRTLLLDLAELHRPDFSGVSDVRAATGLEVRLADADEPDAALAHRWLDLHGLHQARIGLEFGVGDPLGGNGVIAGGKRVQLGLKFTQVVGNFRHVEV